MKFEDRSQEETDRQQRCARSKAWNLAENIYKLKEKDQVTFYSPAEEWVLPEPEEREFVVDSGASMQRFRAYRLVIQKIDSSVTSCPRGESVKETCWSQTLKNWRRWTHLNFTPEGSMLC